MKFVRFGLQVKMFPGNNDTGLWTSRGELTKENRLEKL